MDQARKQNFAYALAHGYMLQHAQNQMPSGTVTQIPPAGTQTFLPNLQNLNTQSQSPSARRQSQLPQTAQPFVPGVQMVNNPAPVTSTYFRGQNGTFFLPNSNISSTPQWLRSTMHSQTPHSSALFQSPQASSIHQSNYSPDSSLQRSSHPQQPSRGPSQPVDLPPRSPFQQNHQGNQPSQPADHPSQISPERSHHGRAPHGTSGRSQDQRHDPSAHPPAQFSGSTSQTLSTVLHVNPHSRNGTINQEPSADRSILHISNESRASRNSTPSRSSGQGFHPHGSTSSPQQASSPQTSSSPLTHDQPQSLVFNGVSQPQYTRAAQLMAPGSPSRQLAFDLAMSVKPARDWAPELHVITYDHLPLQVPAIDETNYDKYKELMQNIYARSLDKLRPHEFLDYLTMDHNASFRPKSATVCDILFMQALLFKKDQVLLVSPRAVQPERWEPPQSVWHAVNMNQESAHALMSMHVLKALHRVTDLLPNELIPCRGHPRHDSAVNIIRPDGGFTYGWAIALSYEVSPQFPKLLARNFNAELKTQWCSQDQIRDMHMDPVWKTKVLAVFEWRRRTSMASMPMPGSVGTVQST